MESIARSGEAGDVDRAKQRLAELTQTMNVDVLTALRRWLADVLNVLDEFMEWPDAAREPEKTRLSLRENARSALARSDAAAAVSDCN
jgi:hypothetical protein